MGIQLGRGNMLARIHALIMIYTTSFWNNNNNVRTRIREKKNGNQISKMGNTCHSTRKMDER